MLRNYLKIGLRNLLKQKGYSFINITGLAVGIACCLLILRYVKDEFTFDHYHLKADQIHKVFTRLNLGGDLLTVSSTSYAEALHYAEEIPEVEGFVRIRDEVATVKKGNEYLNETNLVFADPSLFEVFDFDVTSGILPNAAELLNSLIITEKLALKYFNDTDVVGERLTINVKDGFEEYVVKAVIANHPGNSSFTFQMVMPWKKMESQKNKSDLNDWGNMGTNSYLVLQTGADIEAVEAKMKMVRKRFTAESVLLNSANSALAPLKTLHLSEEFGKSSAGVRAGSDPTYSHVLSGIGLLILIIACINFTNMSVARSFPRAKEIGLRKVMGALQKQVAIQFLTESFVVCLLAFVLGLLMAEFALPVFEQLTQRKFSSSLLDGSLLMFACFLLLLLTTLLSSFYPAFVVSRFNTINSLKGKIRMSGKNWLSRALVVIQFSMAAALVIGTVTMNRQVNFMQNMELGYEDQNLIRLDLGNAGVENLAVLLKNQLSKDPNVLSVTATGNLNSATELSNPEIGKEFIAYTVNSDGHLLETLKTNLLLGESLKVSEASHTRVGQNGESEIFWNVVVNERFVEEMGWEDPVGKAQGGRFKYKVVGVVNDFYLNNSVKAEVSPAMYSAIPNIPNESLLIRFDSQHLTEIKQVLEKTWSALVPLSPMEMTFMSDLNERQYENEARWKQIITYSAGLCIFISVMGLLGLAHLATQQRTKEIGIRKVLGASLGQIVLLINSDFSQTVLISLLLASPLAYYALEGWLDSFINRIDISPWLFIGPALITFGIAFITVSLQSLKKANANPIDSLRYE